MPKNLHIFNDPHGFFTNKTVSLMDTIDKNNNEYINTTITCQHKIEKIQYISIKQFLTRPSESNYARVFFHSYNYANKGNIKEIKIKFPKSDMKFIWVFWSHEYYQLPEFFRILYQGFSNKYYVRKMISFHFEHFMNFFKRQVKTPFYMGLNSLKKTFKEFDVMASLVEDDFKNVMNNVEGVNYAFVSYISLMDFPNTEPDFSIERNEIMIGHSGSPILNHYEIVKKLYGINVKSELYIPLAYGKLSYIKSLRAKIEETTPGMNIFYQTEFMTKEEYYKKIHNVGFFILNSFCQQALGNIVFFLWTGTKIFVRKETSTYKTFKDKSFYIYSIDDDLSKEGLVPLTLQQKQHNKDLIFSMINDEAVKNAWLRILNYNV